MIIVRRSLTDVLLRCCHVLFPDSDKVGHDIHGCEDQGDRRNQRLPETQAADHRAEKAEEQGADAGAGEERHSPHSQGTEAS